VGIPDNEESKWKIMFSISELKSNSDCSGDAISADLIGCWNYD
jgi:hypothetical protein